jgi:hypothetical protein
MPPKTTSRKKGGAARKLLRKPARGKVAKAPMVLTYGKTQEFLHETEEWWAHLRGDVSAIEEMIRQLPADQPLSAEVKRRFRSMVKKITRNCQCAFPFIQDICV